MRVVSYLSHAPITIARHTDYWKASDIMQDRDLHHIPVVNGSDEVVGMFTLRDLKIAAMHFGEAHVEVSVVMHSPVVTVTPDESLAEAARKMADNRIGALPVLDGEGRIVGILTETDMLRALIDRPGEETAWQFRAVRSLPAPGSVRKRRRAACAISLMQINPGFREPEYHDDCRLLTVDENTVDLEKAIVAREPVRPSGRKSPAMGHPTGAIRRAMHPLRRLPRKLPGRDNQA